MAGSSSRSNRESRFTLGGEKSQSRRCAAVSDFASCFLELKKCRMFVRGLQGAYNLYTPQYGIHIPHGDLLVFGACSGQIMFSFLFNPETMPKEYNTW